MGITLVGLSSVLSGEGSQTHLVSIPQMLLGMGLIIASQARGLLIRHIPMLGLGLSCKVVVFHAKFVLSHTALSTTGEALICSSCMCFFSGSVRILCMRAACLLDRSLLQPCGDCGAVGCPGSADHF